MTIMPTTSPAQSPHQPSGTRTARGSHHWWRWVAAVVVVLVVVFLAASWYFSGQIAAGALTATPEGALPSFDDVEVVAVDSDSVTLAKGPDAGVNFDADAVYGLAWDGGTGIVGAAAPGPDGTVIRPLEEIVTGTPPMVGQLAALDSAYWLAEPSVSLGLTPTDVMVDGVYPAWLFPADATAAPTTTMAIAVHGQNGSRSDMLRSVEAVHRAGLPVLDITYRNDLGVPADPTGRLQYGASEWQDLDAAVSWARANGADDIVLVGQSMGGSIVASFLENSEQADVVSRVVLDAPMLSLGATVENAASTAMPVTGGAVPPPVIWAAEQLTTVRYGVDWAAVDYLDDTSWVSVPTLVLHGTADPRVPVALSEQLAAAEPELVRLVTIADALHVEAWNVDPNRWSQEVVEFLGSPNS